MGIFYRAQQFWQAIRIKELPQTVVSDINTQLTPAEQAIFYKLPISDQWHSYKVLQTLQSAGAMDSALQTAALLHDVGKAQSPLSVWDRSFIVVMKRLLPEKTAVWGEGEAMGWKRPFVVRENHPAWGAKMATAANSNPAAIDLIARHQSPPAANDEQLRLLQWADDQN